MGQPPQIHGFLRRFLYGDSANPPHLTMVDGTIRVAPASWSAALPCSFWGILRFARRNCKRKRHRNAAPGVRVANCSRAYSVLLGRRGTGERRPFSGITAFDPWRCRRWRSVFKPWPTPETRLLNLDCILDFGVFSSVGLSPAYFRANETN